MLGNKSLPSGKLRGKQPIALGVFFIEEQVRWFKKKINPINGLMCTDLLQELILEMDLFSYS